VFVNRITVFVNRRNVFFNRITVFVNRRNVFFNRITVFVSRRNVFSNRITVFVNRRNVLRMLHYFTQLVELYLHGSGLQGPRSSGRSARGSDSTFFSCAPRACACLIRPGSETKKKSSI
jgi:hypothetical protein